MSFVQVDISSTCGVANEELAMKKLIAAVLVAFFATISSARVVAVEGVDLPFGGAEALSFPWTNTSNAGSNPSGVLEIEMVKGWTPGRDGFMESRWKFTKITGSPRCAPVVGQFFVNAEVRGQTIVFTGDMNSPDAKSNCNWAFVYGAPAVQKDAVGTYTVMSYSGIIKSPNVLRGPPSSNVSAGIGGGEKGNPHN